MMVLGCVVGCEMSDEKTNAAGSDLDVFAGGTVQCAEAAEEETASLSCPAGQTIASIGFASYGTPTGSCPVFKRGTCHALGSLKKVKTACLNKASCSVLASNDVFGDPCSGVGKKIAIKYTCSGTGTGTEMPVFLMAGQSNMVGRVDVDLFDQLMSELENGSSNRQQRLIDRLKSWYQNTDAMDAYSAQAATVAASELIRLHGEGLVNATLSQPYSKVYCIGNETYDPQPLALNCGGPYGPELVLGHALGSASYAPTSLIKVAEGGTTLYADWLPPSAASRTGREVGYLYNQLSQKIKALQTNPASVHPNCASQKCRWAGFIWFQGENDSFDAPNAEEYQQNLKNLLSDVRSETGSPQLPVVIVQINAWAQSMDYGKQVASAQQAVVNSDPKAKLVVTNDLGLHYHYDSAGQLVIGARVAKALIPMLGGTTTDECPDDPNKTQPGQCGCGVPEGTCSPSGSGLKGTYFNNMDFTAQVVVRQDATVDFNWGRGSPDPSMDGDEFSVRWTGFVKPKYTQTYTFYTVSDDAVRLWIDGKQVINNWTDHSETEDSGTIALQVGKSASVKMEYYEGGGDAVAKLLWSSSSQPKQVIPKEQLSTDSGSGVDNCPDDPNKTEPGLCGCGVPEGTCGGGDAKCVVTADEYEAALLSCANGQLIESISFASWGTPSGTCPNFVKGTCHASSSQSKVQSLCLNKPSCTIKGGENGFNDVFGDPCGGVGKKLAVAYTCGGSVDTTQIENALTALTNHLKGTPKLNAAQIAAQKAVIDANLIALGANSEIIGIAFNLVTTYESVLGPLFMNAANVDMNGGTPWNPGFDRNALKNDIHMAVMNVMQGIVDHVYTPGNLSLHESVMNGFKFKSSEYFPGKVTSTPNPSVVHTATINGSYPKAWGRPVMNDGVPWARRPTGTYLAPGSIATVTVPQSLVGKGFQIRVGVHAEDFSKSNDFIRRLDRVSLVYPVNSAATKVANPFGGGIYIDVPALANAGIVTVQIQNAVRAPFYSTTSYRKTTLAQWQNTERNFGAPWADFQTEKFMTQLPTSWIYKYNDPATFLTFWDNAMDAVSDLMGFPRLRNKEVLYMLPDRSYRYGCGAPGYPSSNMLYFPQDEPYSGNEQNGLTMGPAAVSDPDVVTEFHELGHGQLFAKLLDWEYESAIDILGVAVANRKVGKSLDEAHRMQYGSPDDTYKTLTTTAIQWMTCENFKLGKYMSEEESGYQIKGSAKYVQLVDLFGWGVLDTFWRSTNLDHEAGVTVDMSINGLILRMSKAAGADVTPLLHFWGNLPSDIPAMKAAIAAANIPKSAKIYDRLVQYKSSVPANNQAFRTFAQNWWKKQPSSESWGTELYHAQLWDSYDESYASLIKNNIQKIINLYFPSGRP
jgi:hypothetical protein